MFRNISIPVTERTDVAKPAQIVRCPICIGSGPMQFALVGPCTVRWSAQGLHSSHSMQHSQAGKSSRTMTCPDFILMCWDHLCMAQPTPPIPYSMLHASTTRLASHKPQATFFFSDKTCLTLYVGRESEIDNRFEHMCN